MLFVSGQILANHQNSETDQISTANAITSSSSMNQTDLNMTDKLDYLSQLLKDKRQLATLPTMFIHVERLLDQEINQVRVNLPNSSCQQNLALPEPNGEKKILQEKIFIPIQEYPEFNFVGRILGPRGMTAKQFEIDTGCKIMVRGRGSMRDKQKEDQNRGKPNWEHLNEDLHVLIQCEDYENRASIKLERAKEEVNKLLKPTAEGEDILKKKQLTELAIINGTYREPNTFVKKFHFDNNQLPIGAPLIVTPRLPQSLFTPHISPNTTSTFLTATETPSTIAAVPHASILQNNESNFVQIFTPYQTMDQIGGILPNGTPLLEYSSQTTLPFLTTSTPTGITTGSAVNNSSGKIAPTATGSSVSARYRPYTIQSTRPDRS